MVNMLLATGASSSMVQTVEENQGVHCSLQCTLHQEQLPFSSLDFLCEVMQHIAGPHATTIFEAIFVNDVLTSDLVSDSLSSCLKFHFLGLLLVCNCLSYKSNI
jgi:hypothetical protein